MNALIAAGIFAAAIATHEQEAPKVYLIWKSAGNTWNAMRDQSQEMAKDLVKDCPEVQVTTNQQDADYQLSLNHIEVGLFVRDNQLAVSDMFGNLLSTKERGSIRGGVKGACALILADWSNQAAARQRLIIGINAMFQKEGVTGYAEASGDILTVHSERASAMRFRMILTNRRHLSMARRAGFVTYAYTNDIDQNFQYDLKSDQIILPAPEQAVRANN
jgi:hypothetical protein